MIVLKDRALLSMKNVNHFIVFAALILFKLLFFQWEIYHSIAISSLFSNPLFFWSFWLPKISVALLIASPALFFQKNWWTVFAALSLDVWTIGNFFYFRSTGVLFDGFAFTMAGNMDGFWSSLLALWNWKDILLICTTLLYFAVLFVLNKKKDIQKCHTSLAATVLITSVIFSWLSMNTMIYRLNDNPAKSASFIIKNNPFSWNNRKMLNLFDSCYGYSLFSVVHGFVYMLVDYWENLTDLMSGYEPTDEEKQQIMQVMGSEAELHHDNPLILVLVESLENWAMNEDVMPHLTHFMENHPTLYASQVKSQILYGVSSDGQLMAQTGLMPIQHGAVVFRYPHNKFPSLTSHRDSSVTILTHKAQMWNQRQMSESYGYTKVVEGDERDSVAFKTTVDFMQRGYKTLLVVTIASHLPFTHADRSSMHTPKDMPSDMSNYVKTLYWTDSGLAYMLDRVDSIPNLKNATIMITGDHKIFWQEKRDEFEKYCKKSGTDWDVQNDHCPLIIYSPQIKENVRIKDECYQMDIYPTLLALTGNENYHWKGFGINLLDSTVERKVDEQTAYALSEAMIRSNWFANPVCHVNPDYGQHYIAHGGGRIGGHNYSNSKEAVLQSIDNGINFIELDLAMSSDGKLVYLHDWYGFNWMTTGEPREYVMSYEEYVKSKIFEQYTPITTEWLIQLYEEHPNLWLVTDKISTPEIIDQHFAKIKDRTLVECFSEADYLKLDSMGYKVMRSCWPPTKFAKLKHTLKEKFGKHNDYPYNHNVCEVNANISSSKFDRVALYSVDTKAQADSIFAVNPKVHLVYVNSTGE